jgi:N-methylhydantoinase A/oxoprolinase/acetone carboxylase beta subunit
MPSKITSITDKLIQLPILNSQKTILLTTKGYKDIYSLQNNPFYSSIINKVEIFSGIIEVDESIDENGLIIKELSENSINRSLCQVFEAKPEIILIALLNSLRNPLHENILENLLRTAGFESIYSSHKIE